MTAVGIRELRQNASAVLRRVEAGETVEVTDRGRPVALLTPHPGADGLEALRAAGDVTAATHPDDPLPEPLPPLEGQESASDALARLRRDER